MRFSLFRSSLGPFLIGFLGYLLVYFWYQPREAKSTPKTSYRPGSGEFFDGIASMYDATNKVMTFGFDMSWRQNMVDLLAFNHSYAHQPRFLDLATGTGDVAILCAKSFLSTQSNKIALDKRSTDNPVITALDPSANMISYGRDKVERQGLSKHIKFILGNSEKLPFPDKHFDRVTMSFGIRNVQYRDTALREMKRVLRNDGALGIMEFSKPQQGLLKLIGEFFIRYVMPGLAGLFTAGRYEEYMYLRDSILAFPDPPQFRDLLVKEIGFKSCEVVNAFQHIVFIYICKK